MNLDATLYPRIELYSISIFFCTRHFLF
jgi:hypothetical protein